MRQLATIQRILAITPIENADAIECATILGWHVVVKKGEFKVGDLCVYCEIDSVLPPREEFSFLAPKYRIKTVRLRGQISQGICFPLSILPPDDQDILSTEGTDVTELLGITKYDPPVPGAPGVARGNFPSFIPKTDETRLQAYPKFLEKYSTVPFYTSEKLDGTSVTFFIKDNEFHACSRNMDLLFDENTTIWRVAKELDLEGKMRKSGCAEKIAIQGEMVGGKIQSNRLKLPETTIYFFNAYNFEENSYLNFYDFRYLITREMELKTVPIVDVEVLPKYTVDEMVEYSTRKSELNREVWSEGVVWRPLLELMDDRYGRVSFKVINPEYLLQHGE